MYRGSYNKNNGYYLKKRWKRERKGYWVNSVTGFCLVWEKTNDYERGYWVVLSDEADPIADSLSWAYLAERFYR